MKRVISYLLALVMLICLASPVIAEVPTADRLEDIVSQYGGNDPDELRDLILSCLYYYEQIGTAEQYLDLIEAVLESGEEFDLTDILNIRQIMAGVPEGSLPDGNENSGQATVMSSSGTVRADENVGGIRPKVAIGQEHTVYLTATGTVLTWGKYYNGDTYIAVNSDGIQKTVTELTNVIDVAAGGGSALALKSDGTVWAWGINSHGQLGDNTFTDKTEPVQVRTASGYLTNVTAVAMGQNNAAAITSDGSVYTWGDNSCGQLGNNTAADSPVAVRVVGVDNAGFLNQVKAISVGNRHMLALRTDGTVVAWGAVCGDTTSSNSPHPVSVAGPGGTGILDEITKISAGGEHSLALGHNGAVYAWGSNDKGQLGNGTNTDSSVPVQVLGIGGSGTLQNVTDISAGACFSAVRRSNGKIAAWGDNSHGQLADGTLVGSNIPVETDNIEMAAEVCAGADHLTVKKGNGQIWSIGSNDRVELNGEFPIERALSWQIVYTPLGRLIDVSASLMNSMALTSDGTLFGAGRNSHGQLGLNSTALTIWANKVLGPEGQGYLTDVVAASSGTYCTLALKADGTVWAWGMNTDHQLGDGTTVQRLAPVQVKGPNGQGFLTDVVAISADGGAYRAIKADGTLWSWGGANTYPTQVTQSTGAAVTGMVQIFDKMALKYDGTVWTTGGNSSGELGIGAATSYSTTDWVQVKGVGGSGYLTNIVQIGSGLSNIALSADGNVYAWGNNVYGTCGNNTTVNQSTPVRVKGLSNSGYLTDVVRIIAASTHNYAIVSTGELVGWGNNWDGQLGVGMIENQFNYPTYVLRRGAVVTDDYGDNYASAFEIPLNRWIYGFRRGNNVDGDYFTFVYNGIGNANIILVTNDEAEENVSLYFRHYNPETNKYTTVSKAADGTYPLVKGERYYLWAGYDKDDASYKLRVSAAVDDCGDTTADATEIPSIDGEPRHTTYGTLDHTGDNDMYKFSAGSDAEYTISSSGSGSLHGVLMDSNGTQIATSSGSEGDGNFEISRALTSGATYYVKISSSSPEYTVGTYQLHISQVNSEGEGTPLNMVVTAGEEYDIVINAESLNPLSDSYTIEYDGSYFDIVDLCVMTSAEETTTCEIPETGLDITDVSAGTIVFSRNVLIPDSRNMSGAINIIRLRAKKTGATAITLN